MSIFPIILKVHSHTDSHCVLKEIKINRGEGGQYDPLLIGWNHTKNNPSKAYPKDPKHQFSIKSQLYSFYKLYNGYYNSTKLVKHHIVCVDGRKKQKMTSKHAFYAKNKKKLFSIDRHDKIFRNFYKTHLNYL